MRTINLEAGMPCAALAHNRLLQELRTSRALGERTLKIIHGYGSSGRGGAIKADVLATLAQQKREGRIREFVRGEDFSPFSEAARTMTARCPALLQDRDYARGNDGITIVLL